MPYVDKQKHRDYQREWIRRKRAGLPTKGIRKRKCLTEEEKKIRQQKYQKEYYERKRQEALQLLGNKCFICGRNDRAFSFHKKDGVEHNSSRTHLLVIKDPNDFVLLCRQPCHRAVHWVMEFFNMTWNEIIEKLIYLNKI